MDIRLVATVDKTQSLPDISTIDISSLPSLSRESTDTDSPALILGRQTHETVNIKTPPSRTLPRIVLSANTPPVRPAATEYVSTIPKALDQAHRMNNHRAYVLGGYETFSQLVPYSSHLCLFRQEEASNSNRRLSRVDPQEWELFQTTSLHHTPDRLEIYHRQSTSPGITVSRSRATR